jgi:hypothetical protein
VPSLPGEHFNFSKICFLMGFKQRAALAGDPASLMPGGSIEHYRSLAETETDFLIPLIQQGLFGTSGQAAG